MSFREKSAWVTLIALIVVLMLFWSHIPPPSMLAPAPSMFVLHVLMLTISIFIVIEIIAHVVIAIRSPRDARTPKDERERLIELKSLAIAWYVFVILSLGGIFFTIHLGANEIGLGFVVLLSFVIAEIVNYAFRIYYYRRGF
jgi:tellurite resistance protein TehA-like permease